MSSLLTQALSAASDLKYPLLFIGAIIEGPVLMISCGFFLRLGELSIIPLYIALLCGDLTGDVVWYCIGRFFGEPFIKRFGRFFGLDIPQWKTAQHLFNRFHVQILLISKITIGFGMSLPVLMTAGATRVRFWVYMLLNFLGGLVMVSILLGIGYFYGDVYGTISEKLKTVFILGMVVFTVVALRFFTHSLKGIITKK